MFFSDPSILPSPLSFKEKLRNAHQFPSVSLSLSVGNEHPLHNFESELGLSRPSVLEEGRCLIYFTRCYKISNQNNLNRFFISVDDSKVQHRTCRKAQRQDLARASFIVSAVKKDKMKLVLSSLLSMPLRIPAREGLLHLG